MIPYLRLSQLRLFCIGLLVLAFAAFHPGSAQSNRYSVAVLPFVVTDPTGKTPEALGETLPNYFEAPVFNSQKFILIDRSITDKIMEEITLSDQGFTGEKIKEFGDLYGIDIFINGSITVEQQSEQPYVINARFTDASTGEVKSVSLVRAASTSEFQVAAQQIIDQAITRFPLRGSVYAIEGSVIYIDVGSIHGLSQQDRTGLIYREVPIKEKTIREQIGTFSIDTVYDDSSKITAQMNTGYQVQEGDIVTVEPIATSVAPTPEAAKGSLSVESDVPAQVFLDGAALGQTPLNTEVTAGEHRLELRADGYQTLEKTITVNASQFLTVPETLEPLPATVTLSLTPAGTVARIDGRIQLNRTFTLSPGQYTLELRTSGYETKTLTLSLAPGETKTITESLAVATEPQTVEPSNSSTAVLNLFVSPSTAIVTIDGLVTRARTLVLTPGIHTIKVEAEGYESSTIQRDLQAGQTYPVNVILQSAKGQNNDMPTGIILDASDFSLSNSFFITIYDATGQVLASRVRPSYTESIEDALSYQSVYASIGDNPEVLSILAIGSNNTDIVLSSETGERFKELQTSSDYSNRIVIVRSPSTETDSESIENSASTQLPSGRTTLKDAYVTPEKSGFRFQSAFVFPWNNPFADIWVGDADSNGKLLFFLPNDLPPFQDVFYNDALAGIFKTPHTELDEVTQCPEMFGVYQYHFVGIEVNSVYCVRARDGEHYAKIKVIEASDKLVFDWVYQPDGSTSFELNNASESAPSSDSVLLMPDQEQEFIQLAKEGGVVNLGAGTFILDTSLILNNSVEIVGQGPGVTILQGKGTNSVLSFVGDGTFTMRNLTVEYTGSTFANVVFITDGRATLENLIVQGAKREGYGKGILFSGDSQGTIKNSFVQNNDFDGIQVTDKANVNLEDSKVEFNGDSGISYIDDSWGTAKNNRIRNNIWCGIYIGGWAQPILENNTVLSNQSGGICFNNNAGGAARNNTTDGIGVYDNAEPVLENNRE